MPGATLPGLSQPPVKQRDLRVTLRAAMVMIYIILVAQTGSFLLPVVVMLAISQTVIGVMPGVC
jgi:multidrug efflux pump subunit AcrB